MPALPTAIGEFSLTGGRYAAVGDYVLEMQSGDGTWVNINTSGSLYLPAGYYRHPGASPAQTVVTETSTTPTTVSLTLASGLTGVRVWLGEQPVSETDFYLYVKRNATTYKVKCYRNSAPIINGVAGDTFAFGTSDGRTIYVTPITVPTALVSSFPVSGTANADKAGPPSWSPSAAHITLVDFNSAISLAADAGQRVVFISEYDGAAWTPVRSVMLHPSRATVVQCTYRLVALANYGGATVSVSAPTGAIIGGTSTQMHLTFPAVTGTTRNVTTVANFKTAMAAAVAGDEIVLAAGTYALDVAITNATFAANSNSAKGILIRGGTGTRSDVVITGNVSGTNGNWSLTGGPSSAQPVMFKDLTFSFQGLGACAFLQGTGGYGLYENVRFTGVATTVDTFSFNNSSTLVNIDAMWCSFDNSAGDCVNGAGTAGQNAASRVRLIGCDTELPLDAANAQGITSHTGLAVSIFGGTHKSANTNIIAPDAATTPMYVFYARLEKGTRRAGFSNTTIIYGCYADITATVTIGAGAKWKGNYLVGDGASVIRNALADSQIEGNFCKWASGASIRGFHNSNSSGDVAGVIFNVFDGFPEGLRFMDSAGAGGTARSTNNTYANSTTGQNLQDINLLVINKNNAVYTATTGVNCTATSMPKITTNYNTIDPTIDADFVAGAQDIVNANAGLDTYFFPTASGNCDGNGDSSLYDWIGGRDCYGYGLIYLPNRVSRGGRDIAAKHTDAVLFPGVY